MLAIKKRYDSVKALSAGALAFAIGLTGAAAYVGGTLVHENLTFSKEQTTVSKPAEKSTEPTVKVEAAESEDTLYSSQTPFYAPIGSNPSPSSSSSAASPTQSSTPTSSTSSTISPISNTTSGTSSGSTGSAGDDGGASLLPICKGEVLEIIGETCRLL